MKYRHKRTGKIYTMVENGMMKTNGRWEMCVIYRNELGDLFVRTTDNFYESFEETP